MNAKFSRLTLAALTAGFAIATSLHGYTLRTERSSIDLVKWEHSPLQIVLKLSNVGNLSDGHSHRSSVVAAMNSWNAQLGTLQFLPIVSNPGVYSPTNGANEIVVDDAIDGEAFPNGALAVTISYEHGNGLRETDIVFNDTYTWDSYRGSLRTAEDIHRVAIHELGHVLGLDHPDEAGQSVTALMNSHVSDVDQLQAHDIASGQALYGAPGVSPSNDSFASATSIALAQGSIQLSGTNIGGSRQASEPFHAASAGKHSVWWKWTAPYEGSFSATTLNSNFDTVLAVYTGSELSSLTAVASNDDEDPFNAATPHAIRKRTSKVTFDVVVGVTYYFAVDAWSEDSVFTRQTGSIHLNLEFTPRIAPFFRTHPRNYSAMEHDTIELFAEAGGMPEPTYRWQQQTPGGGWTEVPTAGDYREHGMGLSVRVTTAMDGEQFRCVATNVVGSTYSQPALLRVTAIPLPVIAIQPASEVFFTGVARELAVEARGVTHYQWYRNGAALAGMTGARLTFPNPQASDAGEYHVVVTNLAGSVSSAKAKIIVTTGPVITSSSARRQIVSPGESISFEVSAAGEGSLSYQWYHNGRPIPGATSNAFHRAIASSADTGAYWVAVTERVSTRHSAPFFAVFARPATHLVPWGENYAGQLEVPATLTDTVSASPIVGQVFVLTRTGTIRSFGQVSRGTERLTSLTDVVAVAAGQYGTLALKSDGTVIGTQEVGDVPTGLTEAWSIACGVGFGYALKTDGTVVKWGSMPSSPLPIGLNNVVAIAAAARHALALKRDGTVVSWSSDPYSPADVPIPPTGLADVTAIAAGYTHGLALKSDGAVVAWGFNPFSWDDHPNSAATVPVGLKDVIAISAGGQHSLALKTDGSVVAWGENTSGQSTVPPALASVTAIFAGGSSSYALRETASAPPILITQQPRSWSIGAGGTYMFTAFAAVPSGPAPSYQWMRNGIPIAGATSSAFTISSAQPSDTGFYTVAVTGTEKVVSEPAACGLVGSPVLGATAIVGTDILHPNGNVFDQLLLQGAAASFSADVAHRQITRLSFIDLSNDIVQVEFSGPGLVSIVLENLSGPAAPAHYQQPGVAYMKGHAGIVVAGATRDTHLSVFSVGRANALNHSLFREAVEYDGVADLAFVAILSVDGQFGGLRTANVNYLNTTGVVGVFAPGVTFTGPVYIGNVNGSDTAQAKIVVGTANDVQINGGDLLQRNNRPVEVQGNFRLRFVPGTDSHGNVLPEQPNRGRLETGGMDVTSSVIAR